MSRLALSRRPGESIALVLPGGTRIEVSIDKIRGAHCVRLVIDAPTDVAIVRGELLDTYDHGDFRIASDGKVGPAYTSNGRPTQPLAPLLAIGPDSTDLTATARAAAAASSTLSPCGRGQGEGPSSLPQSTTPRDGAAPEPSAVRHAAPIGSDHAAPVQGA